MNDLGHWLTRHVTIPIVLGFIGLFTFPLGIILWAIALVFMFSGPSNGRR